MSWPPHPVRDKPLRSSASATCAPRPVYEALDEALTRARCGVYTIVNRELGNCVTTSVMVRCQSRSAHALLLKVASTSGVRRGDPGCHGVDEPISGGSKRRFTVKPTMARPPIFTRPISSWSCVRTSKTPLSIYLAHRAEGGQRPAVRDRSPPQLRVDPHGSSG